MASSSKRKTTMAKLNRERKVIEKRHKKAARKEARKAAAAEAANNPEGVYAPEGVDGEPVGEQPEPVAEVER